MHNALAHVRAIDSKLNFQDSQEFSKLFLAVCERSLLKVRSSQPHYNPLALTRPPHHSHTLLSLIMSFLLYALLLPVVWFDLTLRMMTV